MLSIIFDGFNRTQEIFDVLKHTIRIIRSTKALAAFEIILFRAYDLPSPSVELIQQLAYSIPHWVKSWLWHTTYNSSQMAKSLRNAVSACSRSLRSLSIMQHHDVSKSSTMDSEPITLASLTHLQLERGAIKEVDGLLGALMQFPALTHVNTATLELHGETQKMSYSGVLVVEVTDRLHIDSRTSAVLWLFSGLLTRSYPNTSGDNWSMGPQHSSLRTLIIDNCHVFDFGSIDAALHNSLMEHLLSISREQFPSLRSVVI